MAKKKTKKVMGSYYLNKDKREMFQIHCQITKDWADKINEVREIHAFTWSGIVKEGLALAMKKLEKQG